MIEVLLIYFFMFYVNDFIMWNFENNHGRVQLKMCKYGSVFTEAF